MTSPKREEPNRVYKICSRNSWEQARPGGRYFGSSDDARDGFIHLSAPDQVAATLERHFADRDDLLLIGVDVGRLGKALRWEPSRGGALFPHLHQPLDFAAVVSEAPLVRDSKGQYRLPDGLASC
ncbi:MAG: DUF952 domain-containing protein [Hyphomicrobiaceae bacterium]